MSQVNKVGDRDRSADAASALSTDAQTDQQRLIFGVVYG